jgi:hypothetical protein
MSTIPWPDHRDSALTLIRYLSFSTIQAAVTVRMLTDDLCLAPRLASTIATLWPPSREPVPDL